MKQEPFLTRPLSTCLDAVRYLSALLVVVGHSYQLGLYVGPYPFTERLQHNCVVVFFVLSGLVIASSLQRGDKDLAQYAIARVSRLAPVALSALVFSTVVYLLSQHLGAPDFHNGHNDKFDLTSLLTPLLFLSESPFGTGPIGNPPYWSLCYEAWFYVMFGMAVFLRDRARRLSIAVAAAVAGLNILLLFPIWIFGAMTADLPALRVADRRLGLLLIVASVASIPIVALFDLPLLAWLRPHAPWSLNFSEWVLSDTMLGLGIAMGFAGLRPIAAEFAPQLLHVERPVRWLAGSAFTLYLFHWPMLNLFRLLGVTGLQSPLAYLAAIAGVVLACTAIAEITERRSPEVRRWLEARFPATRVPAEQH